MPDQSNKIEEKVFTELKQGAVDLPVLRQAIDQGAFKTFEEFEFALFRIVSQGKN